MLKLFTMAVIILAVCSAGAFASYSVGKYFDELNGSQNDDFGFDDCVASGYSIIEIYPRICVDENGNTYTEEIVE